MKFPLALAACSLLAAAADPGYFDEIATWRADRETKLRAPEGWLAVAGLFWLHEGDNVVGSDPLSDIVLPPGAAKRAGTMSFHEGVVRFENAIVKSDAAGAGDVLHVGSVAMTIIVRGGRTAVRLRDPDAATRRDFTGCKWFGPAEGWRVVAKWVAYPAPRTIAITNILGMTSEEPSPGYAEFTLQGQKLRLDPIVEDDGTGHDHLFFMFKDQTSGHTTYGAGRFLYAAMPEDGKVDLDFNKAENPPCAFTAFATCPLPPRRNALPIAIEAGEKMYGKH
jgi:hypothetical protein